MTSTIQAQIKPLQWEPVGTKIQKLFLGFQAQSPIGRYSIGDMGPHRKEDRWWLELNDVLSKHSTPEEAKAAAQADFNARILSCLAAPEPIAEAVAWVDPADLVHLPRRNAANVVLFATHQEGYSALYLSQPSPKPEAVSEHEPIIDAVMEAARYAPKIIPMGANPPLFDGMQPDNDGPWLSRVDVAKRLRTALSHPKPRVTDELREALKPFAFQGVTVDLDRFDGETQIEVQFPRTRPSKAIPVAWVKVEDVLRARSALSSTEGEATR